ncbi:MAG: Ldh family oxidoreductase [Chloroflexi bacterium]|nr:Ldh family oxidoreductase [Chloroflexota bacterium]
MEASQTRTLSLPLDRADDLCRAVLRTVGFDDREVTDCTEAILFATRRGLDSHGIVSILPAIARGAREGRIQPGATILLERDGPTTALLRGNGAAGPVVGAYAMRTALDKAAEHGLAIVAARNCAHFGAASAYAAMAPPRGMIGIVMCNAGPNVAPYGGTQLLHGTNPIAYAAPAGKEPPIVLDVATSAAAHGQIAKAQRRGQPIPFGWALDAHGQQTDDPAAAKVLLPFGAHKGYGFGILVDLLTGALTGSTIGKGVQQQSADRASGGQAFFFLAIDISAFTQLATFDARAEQLIHDAHGVAPASPNGAVLLPGELEWREEQRRQRAGVPIEAGDWQALVAGLERAGIDPSIAEGHAPDGL